MSEAIKEPLRLVVLAVIAWALAGGLDYVVGLFGFPLDATMQLTALLLLILRGPDKWLHEKGKEWSTTRVDNKWVKGITRF